MARKITEQPFTPTGGDINRLGDTTPNTIIKYIAYTQKDKKKLSTIFASKLERM